MDAIRKSERYRAQQKRNAQKQKNVDLYKQSKIMAEFEKSVSLKVKQKCSIVIALGLGLVNNKVQPVVSTVDSSKVQQKTFSKQQENEWRRSPGRSAERAKKRKREVDIKEDIDDKLIHQLPKIVSEIGIQSAGQNFDKNKPDRVQSRSSGKRPESRGRPRKPRRIEPSRPRSRGLSPSPNAGRRIRSPSRSVSRHRSWTEMDDEWRRSSGGRSAVMTNKENGRTIASGDG